MLTLNDAGSVSAAEERRKAEIRRRLAASLGGAPAEAPANRARRLEKKTLASFLTPAEVAARRRRTRRPSSASPRRSAARSCARKAGRRRAGGRQQLIARVGSSARDAAREEEGSPDRRGRWTARRRDAQFAAALTKAKRRTDERILAEMAGDGRGEEEATSSPERALARSRRAAVRILKMSAEAWPPSSQPSPSAARRTSPSTGVGTRGRRGGRGVQRHAGVRAGHRCRGPSVGASAEGSGDVDDMPPRRRLPPPPPPGSRRSTAGRDLDHDDACLLVPAAAGASP